MIKIILILLSFSFIALKANDSITIMFTDDGFKNVTIEEVEREIAFDNPNQILVVGINEAVLIEFNEFDPYKFVLISTRQKNSSIAWLSLVSKEDPKIFIDDLCSSKEVYGITSVPEVIIDEKLSSDILTFIPILNDKCEKVGIAIYYGNKQTGCSDLSHDIVSKLNDCNGTSISSSKNTHKNLRKVVVENKDECLENLWFGLPCP